MFKPETPEVALNKEVNINKLIIGKKTKIEKDQLFVSLNI